MLTFEKANKKIARIEGGEHDGEYIYIYDPDYKCCANCTEECKTARKKCCDKCLYKKGSKKGGCGSCGGSKLNKRHIFSEIKLKEGRVVPIPNQDEDQADHVYVAGQTGAGKSSWIGNYIKELKSDNPKKDLFIFSTFDEDKALDDLKPTRIIIDQDVVDEPIQKEELKDSVCIFDDIDTIRPKNLAKACQDLRNDLLQNGRKMHIRVMSTSHQLMNYKLTRDLLNSCQKIVYFPQATSPHHVKRFLTEYVGLDKKGLKMVTDINSRWIMVSINFPSYILWDKGCLIINKMNANNVSTKDPNNEKESVYDSLVTRREIESEVESKESDDETDDERSDIMDKLNKYLKNSKSIPKKPIKKKSKKTKKRN